MPKVKNTRLSKPVKIRIRAETNHAPRAPGLKIKRVVYARDRGACAYPMPDGKPCGSKFALQYDHFPVPYAHNGPTTAENLRLACAAHNALHARSVFSKS